MIILITAVIRREASGIGEKYAPLQPPLTQSATDSLVQTLLL